jgi:glycosyltransferase involved in cell wall biosynthesis
MEHLPIVAQYSRDDSPGFDQRSGVLFLGNFKNLANRDALDWLLNEIWPLVQRQRSDLTLFIAGHGCPTDLAGRGASIITLGNVPDLGETFRSRLALVAPIRVGTGINTKNLQALAHGLPVVTTSIGAEGLRLVDAQTALVAETPREFAANILNICSNAPL